MPRDDRPLALARLASGLAAGAAVDLPASLALWSLAGGRPSAAPQRSDDPADALGTALEATLTHGERRRGAHYTPGDVADRAAAMALGDPAIGSRPLVVDPTCGGGALLLAAGRRLVAAGVPRDAVARDLLWGADIDPLAAAVTEAAIALWAGGTAPAAGHVVVADTLLGGLDGWPDPPDGFDALIGNPPFQGQLGRDTARTTAEAAALRARFGDAVSAYVDTAALFLLAGCPLVRPGGRMAVVLPESVVAARDAAAVRAALGAEARLDALWAPAGPAFRARVNVCVAQLTVQAPPEPRPADWSDLLAAARGVPPVELMVGRTVADVATTVASFRQEYYGLAPHVREAAGPSRSPLVTSGLIDVGTSAWGIRPVRFAKRTWQRPEVDLDGARTASGRVRTWLDRVERPKVVVASQTRVLEAAADVEGAWVPSTPAVCVVPDDPADVARLAAVLCAPPVAVWARRRAAGTALSPRAIRVSASLLADVPLPCDDAAWMEAADLLVAGDLDAFGRVATAMYGLSRHMAADVQQWWHAERPTLA